MLPQVPSASAPSFKIERLEAPYFTREPLANGRVLAYRFLQVGREAADAWYDDVYAYIMAWPMEQRYCSLLDLRGKEHLISAQAYSRARQITHVRPELVGRVAFLIGRGLVAPIVNTLMRNALDGTTRERLMFTTEAIAISWLLSSRD